MRGETNESEHELSRSYRARESRYAASDHGASDDSSSAFEAGDDDDDA